MKVLVAATVAAYKCDNDTDKVWLAHARAWRAAGAEFFCAVQVGHGHDERFGELDGMLGALEATVWTFSIDESVDAITTHNRLIGITTGRNLAHEYVANRRPDVTHLLLLDTDVVPTEDLIERLAEVQHPVVGGNIPTYVLDGPAPDVRPHPERRGHFVIRSGPGYYRETNFAPYPEGADVREHWTSAGCLLLQRDVVRRIRWRWDLGAGSTDDPCFAADCEAVGFGRQWVRHDLGIRHYPESIAPVEHRGHDLSICR